MGSTKEIFKNSVCKTVFAPETLKIRHGGFNEAGSSKRKLASENPKHEVFWKICDFFPVFFNFHYFFNMEQTASDLPV